MKKLLLFGTAMCLTLLVVGARSEGKYGVYCFTEKHWILGADNGVDNLDKAKEIAREHSKDNRGHSTSAYPCATFNGNCEKLLN